MGRSNTLPTKGEPKRQKHNDLHRGATVVEQPSSTEPTSSHHGIHLPHLHLHGNSNGKPSGNSSGKTVAPTMATTAISESVTNDSRSTASRPAMTKKQSRTARTANGSRPGLPVRQNSVQTRYMDMLLALDTIPRLHTILASFFTWILLAGFIIFPGTFTALDHVDNDAAKVIFKSVKNIPLLVIAGVCCGIGAGGMLWLWWTWRKNYVWLLNRIFLPGCLNSFAGLISTLVNVYTQQNSAWSVTAEVTAIVSGSVMAITAVLFALYNFWVLERVKRSHSRDMQNGHGAQSSGAEGIREKLKEPALEPGSVV